MSNCDPSKRGCAPGSVSTRRHDRGTHIRQADGDRRVRLPVTRVFNFSAGPAVLPEEVLAQAASEMLDWHGSGMSVMEMSHRGKEFIEIAATAEKDFRELLEVPSNYKVLFLQGGATLHFAAVPMNLLAGKKAADYIYTGE